MQNKILVTGSSGYIGQHLCLYLAKMGYHVTGLDRQECGTGCHEFMHQSILDTADIKGDYDAVVHLAALVQVGMSNKCMMEYYRNNVIGTMNVLERINYDTFIFASTCQANEPHTYGKTKLIGEHLVKDYCGVKAVPHTIFRFGNVAGSAGYEPTNMDGLMYNLMKAKKTGTFNLYGNDYDTRDGTALRDYIHVMEVVYAIEKAIKRPSRFMGAETYPFFEYLGHGKLYSVMECVQAFKKVNNCDFDVVVKPRRIGDPASINTAYQVSPYMIQQRCTLEEMMKL
jgi:UDP-glucose 4-epimerase